MVCRKNRPIKIENKLSPSKTFWAISGTPVYTSWKGWADKLRSGIAYQNCSNVDYYTVIYSVKRVTYTDYELGIRSFHSPTEVYRTNHLIQLSFWFQSFQYPRLSQLFHDSWTSIGTDSRYRFCDIWRKSSWTSLANNSTYSWKWVWKLWS